MEQETKSGVKTTEFWITVAPVLMGMIEGRDDPQIIRYMIVCGSILGGLYIISRTFVKCSACKLPKESE
jgi:hypothetical protein